MLVISLTTTTTTTPSVGLTFAKFEIEHPNIASSYSTYMIARKDIVINLIEICKYDIQVLKDIRLSTKSLTGWPTRPTFK